MGMYTELVLGVDLSRTTPKEVLDILNYMIHGEFEDSVPPVSEHPLFQTERWKWMLQGDSAYFGGMCTSILSRPRYPGGPYRLSIRCNLKNYDSEIELFLNWLAPCIDTIGFIGYMRYEEYDVPWLIYMDNCISLVSLPDLDGCFRQELNDEWLLEKVS